MHAALGIGLLAVAVLVLDSAHPARRRRVLDVLTWPVVALGCNALVLWTGVFVVGAVLERTPAGASGAPLGQHLLQTAGAAGHLALTAGAWLAVACVVHATRWYVRL